MKLYNKAFSSLIPFRLGRSKVQNRYPQDSSETGPDSIFSRGEIMNIQHTKQDIRPISQTPEGLIRAFLAERSEKTRKAYQADLTDFASFLNLNSAQDALGALVSHDQGAANALVLEYKNSLIGRRLSSSTINRRLATIRSAVKLANQLGLVNWTIKIENRKSESYRNTKGPGKNNVFSLIRAASQSRNPAKAARDEAIIRLLYSIALRRGEVARLDLKDFCSEFGTLLVQAKGRDYKQLIRLPRNTVECLIKWLNIRGSEPGPLFPNLDRAGKGKRLTGTSIYRIVRKLGEKAGFQVRPHGLRHTAITEALDLTNGNIRAVQRFSRHKNIQTLYVYDDNRNDFAGEIANMIGNIV